MSIAIQWTKVMAGGDI